MAGAPSHRAVFCTRSWHRGGHSVKDEWTACGQSQVRNSETKSEGVDTPEERESGNACGWFGLDRDEALRR